MVLLAPPAWPTTKLSMDGPNLHTNHLSAASSVVKASAGRVYSIVCSNLHAAAARYIQLHNATAAVTGTEVPTITVFILPQTTLVLGNQFFSDHGLSFSTGIVFGWSSTSTTFTPATATEQLTHITYA